MRDFSGTSPLYDEDDRVRPTQACLEVRSALEIWLSGDERSLRRLEILVRHWCAVYARGEEYSTQALQDATRLAERHRESGVRVGDRTFEKEEY